MHIRNNFILLTSIFFLSCTNSNSKSPDKGFVESGIEKQTSNENMEKDADLSSDFYTSTSLYDGKFTILVPISFKVMSEEKVSIKYPNASQKPDVVYTNEKGSVNVTFSVKNYPTTEEDLPTIKQVFDTQLATTNPKDYKSEIKTINGQKFVVYEFISKAVDANIYNLMFTTDFEGKLLVGAFNCTEELMDEWKPRGKEILASVKKK